MLHVQVCVMHGLEQASAYLIHYGGGAKVLHAKALNRLAQEVAAHPGEQFAKSFDHFEVLKVDIEKGTADAAVLTEKIAKLDDDISVEDDVKAAAKVRRLQKADYDTTSKD